MIQVWLHKDEYEFLKNYSGKKLMTISDLIRYWIRYSMKSERVYKEPTKPMQPRLGDGSNRVRKYIVKVKDKYYGYLWVQNNGDKITQTFSKYRSKKPEIAKSAIEMVAANTPNLEMLARETTIFPKGEKYSSLEKYLYELGIENPIDVTESPRITFRY